MSQVFEFCVSVFIYLVQFYSIFDIYYTSPLTHGSDLVPLNISAPATHVIFIVSDGLRANKLFDHDMNHTPFLRDVLTHRGLWGVSHTRVPTESRPAHVAMLAGFYEDVASITKGWRTNPVEFDSVLNRSLSAWIWGYREVVMSFVSPSTQHIKATPCPDELSDLTKTNPTEIDRWVINQFMDFIDQSEDFFNDVTGKSNDYRQGRMVFLHLDAADMVGHSFKPNSPEYITVLEHLDKAVLQVYQKLTEKSRGTNARIAYILTSDHGMTEWGSHGSGSLHETITPLLIWGSGIVGPVEIKTDTEKLSNNVKDAYGLPLHNYERLRREIQQADLCPLMASLLGVPIPINSVGQVPVEFLKIPESDKVKLARANWLQIYKQLKIKYAEKRKSHFSLLFREFPSLKISHIDKTEQECEMLISSGRYTEAIQKYRQLTTLALEGLAYYHKYDRLYLGLCVSTTFCLWSLVILCRLFGANDSVNHNKYQKYVNSFHWKLINCIIVGFSMVVMAFASSWSLGPTIYQLVPLLTALSMSYSTTRRKELLALMDYIVTGLWTNSSVSTFSSICSITIATIFLLELLVWGFFYRYLLSLACLLFAAWPFIDESFRVHDKIISSLWCFSCCCLAIFPMLPVIGSESYPTFVLINGLILVPIVIISYRMLSHSSDYLHTGLGYLFGLLICLSSFAVYLMSFTSIRAGSLKIFIHLFSWSVIILLPLLVILLVPTRLGSRLIGWTVVYLVPLILMSTFYEVAFFAVFAIVTYLWLYIEVESKSSTLKNKVKIWDLVTSSDNSVLSEEYKYAESNKNLLHRKNFRQSLFFIFLLTVSFFGTGNIASVNSFDPRSTFCFTTILNPALMAVFLLIKVISPMLFLGVIYAAVQLFSDNSSQSLFTPEKINLQAKYEYNSILMHTGLTAVLSNVIAIHFFLWLRDEGSWLDIGTSISHYVIAMSISLAAFLFALLGKKMLSASTDIRVFNLVKVTDKYV
ncbi:unnamed protein product [Trichobilharzia szidati]|nr:unnamed protein product [Trichobilharzia szidati]CAH8840714.1 unnamed protein product [Trichobilharzia szidati]CAH8840717.1 unnamed protein product [Trichobilharzia szidati]